METIHTGRLSVVHDAKYNECDLYKVFVTGSQRRRADKGGVREEVLVGVVIPELSLKGSVCQTKRRVALGGAA